MNCNQKKSIQFVNNAWMLFFFYFAFFRRFNIISPIRGTSRQRPAAQAAPVIFSNAYSQVSCSDKRSTYSSVGWRTTSSGSPSCTSFPSLRITLSLIHISTPLAQFPSKSFVLKEPYGVTLVMSPWNYPFQLTMEPLAGAIAAGNTVLLKPSDYSRNTSQVMADMIHSIFPPEYVEVMLGGREANQDLLNQQFDLSLIHI